jgi:hypothetical protein
MMGIDFTFVEVLCASQETIDGSHATMRGIGALAGTALVDIPRALPDATKPLTSAPVEISL